MENFLLKKVKSISRQRAALVELIYREIQESIKGNFAAKFAEESAGSVILLKEKIVAKIVIYNTNWKLDDDFTFFFFAFQLIKEWPWQWYKPQPRRQPLQPRMEAENLQVHLPPCFYLQEVNGLLLLNRQT